MSLDSLPDVHCEFQRTHDLSNSQEKFPDFQFIHDDVLVTGTSRFRPDFHIDLHTHVLIIECDQKAHAGRHTHLSYTLESGYAPVLVGHPKYALDAERTKKLAADVGNKRPLVVIRLNPDKYMDWRGWWHPGCFRDKARTTYFPEWESRAAVLISIVRPYLHSPPSAQLVEIKLFYPGHYPASLN